MKQIRILQFALVTCAFPAFFLENAAFAQNSAQTIVNDMTLAPVAALHGVPSSYSWASGAATPQPMPVPARNNLGQWFQAMTAWGQAYIPVTGSLATNTRCQIRNLQTRLLLTNGTWTTVQTSGSPQGAAFVEDFANNASIAAGERNEANNGGGVSVIVGVGAWAGHNYHFWPYGSRAVVDVSAIVGVFTTCEARLIVNDPTKPDDRATCRNVLQMGADWWLNTTIGWLPDWSANGGIGGGRTKWVTTNWQSFNMCTMLPANILANPPVRPPAGPFAITNSIMAANGAWFSLIGTGTVNQTYVLLTAPNLPPATWLPVLTNSADASGVFRFTDWQTTNYTQRFYRVLAP
jgi:hypothetical protein